VFYTAKGVLRMFLDMDYDKLDPCDIIRNVTKDFNPTLIAPSPSDSNYTFLEEFIKMFKSSLDDDQSTYEYAKDYEQVCQIIKNPPANVKQLIKDLTLEQEKNHADKDDKPLYYNMNSALDEYISFDYDKLNKSFTNSVRKCKLNVAPHECEIFDVSVTYVPIKHDDDLYLTTAVEAFNIDAIIALSFQTVPSTYTKWCDAIVNGNLLAATAATSATAAKNTITKIHSNYLESLYKKNDLLDALYRLGDDSSAIQIPDVMTKTKNLTKQMLLK